MRKLLRAARMEEILATNRSFSLMNFSKHSRFRLRVSRALYFGLQRSGWSHTVRPRYLISSFLRLLVPSVEGPNLYGSVLLLLVICTTVWFVTLNCVLNANNRFTGQVQECDTRQLQGSSAPSFKSVFFFRRHLKSMEKRQARTNAAPLWKTKVPIQTNKGVSK